MNVQLTLIDSTDGAAPLWQIDDETREIGLAGLRSAREVLAEARSALIETPTETIADAVAETVATTTDVDEEETALPAAA